MRVRQLHPRRRGPRALKDARRGAAAGLRGGHGRLHQRDDAVCAVASQCRVEAGQRRVRRVLAVAALVEAIVVQSKVRGAHRQAPRRVANAAFRVEVELRDARAVRGAEILEVEAARLGKGAAEAVHELEERAGIDLDRQRRGKVLVAEDRRRHGLQQLERAPVARRVGRAHGLRPRRQRGGRGGSGGKGN